MNSHTPIGSAASRSRRETEKRLTTALGQLQAFGVKISISAVAKAAEVTPALIHNTYPDIAERIRSVIGKSTRLQRDEKHEALTEERKRNRELRAEVERLRLDMARLASINLTLLTKLAVEEEASKGKVVALMPATLHAR